MEMIKLVVDIQFNLPQDIGKNVHRIFFKSDSRGFKAYPAQKWKMVQLSTDFNKKMMILYKHKR